MAELPLIDHLTPLTEWLKTYPAVGLFKVNNLDGDIGLVINEPSARSGTNLLQNAGATYTERVDDIVGRTVVDVSARFMLFARRDVTSEWARNETAEFLTHFGQWCVQERIYGRQPKFGNSAEFHNDERISVSGGTPWSIVDGLPDGASAVLYDLMWQINLQYKLVYDEIPQAQVEDWLL